MEKGLKTKCSLSSVQTEKLECKGDDIVLEEKGIDLTSENNTVLEGKRIDLASENDTFLTGYSTETADQLPIREGTEHTNIQSGGNTTLFY